MLRAPSYDNSVLPWLTDALKKWREELIRQGIL
jgi:hypothetical protein